MWVTSPQLGEVHSGEVRGKKLGVCCKLPNNCTCQAEHARLVSRVSKLGGEELKEVMGKGGGDLSALQHHCSGRFREPLIPADGNPYHGVPGCKHFEAGVSGVEVELLLVPA